MTIILVGYDPAAAAFARELASHDPAGLVVCMYNPDGPELGFLESFRLILSPPLLAAEIPELPAKPFYQNDRPYLRRKKGRR